MSLELCMSIEKSEKCDLPSGLDQFSSVSQLCLTLCDPMNCSTPGLPVHHQLLEFTQTHVHRYPTLVHLSLHWACLTYSWYLSACQGSWFYDSVQSSLHHLATRGFYLWGRHWWLPFPISFFLAETASHILSILLCILQWLHDPVSGQRLIKEFCCNHFR